MYFKKHSTARTHSQYNYPLMLTFNKEQLNYRVEASVVYLFTLTCPLRDNSKLYRNCSKHSHTKTLDTLYLRMLWKKCVQNTKPVYSCFKILSGLAVNKFKWQWATMTRNPTKTYKKVRRKNHKIYICCLYQIRVGFIFFSLEPR